MPRTSPKSGRKVYGSLENVREMGQETVQQGLSRDFLIRRVIKHRRLLREAVSP